MSEVGSPDAAALAHAVVRRAGDRAVLSAVTGPAELFARLVAEICDALRADGAHTLTAGPDLPEEVAARAGLSRPVPL